MVAVAWMDPNTPLDSGLVAFYDADGKLIGTWGNGLEALTRAGVVKGRKVTGSPDLADAAKKAGARFTGRQLEAAGHVVTALDEGSGMRFGQALVTAARS